jgi:hypothetical protein
MSWNALPQLEEASVSPKLCQPRRIRIATTLAEVGGGSLIVILYQAGVPIGYLWPFLGMGGVYVMLQAIGFVAACLRADEWEARER